MGMILGVEADIGVRCPYWFTRSDSKNYVFMLLDDGIGDFNPIRALEEQHQLNCQPLKKVGGQDFGLGEYLSLYPDRAEAERQFQREKQLNQAAWQPPEDVIRCLDQIIQRVDADPTLFSALTLPPNWDKPYVREGILLQDLKDLRRMIAWYQEQGAKQIRMTIA